MLLFASWGCLFDQVPDLKLLFCCGVCFVDQVPGRGQREPPSPDNTGGARGGQSSRQHQRQGVGGLQLQAVRQQHCGEGACVLWLEYVGVCVRPLDGDSQSVVHVCAESVGAGT